MKHPIQNTYTDEHGTFRFVPNKVILLMQNMLEEKGLNLNELHKRGCDLPQEDWDQFNQLIGHSVSGAPINEDIREAAYVSHQNQISIKNAQRKNAVDMLKMLKDALRQPMSDLFGVHPDDLE